MIDNIDERFEVPKVNDEVVLSLMVRPHDKVLALPSSHKEYHEVIDSFPWVNQSILDMPDFGQFLRIFKGDLHYLLNMYELEKQTILAAYEEEKLLYNDNGQTLFIIKSNFQVVYWIVLICPCRNQYLFIGIVVTNVLDVLILLCRCQIE